MKKVGPHPLENVGSMQEAREIIVYLAVNLTNSLELKPRFQNRRRTNGDN